MNELARKAISYYLNYGEKYKDLKELIDSGVLGNECLTNEALEMYNEGKITQIKVGIIGYGKVGKIRESLIKNNSNYKLISICDIISSDKVKYTDYREMIDKEKLDAVFICVPHTLTTNIVIYCLSKNLHVFAEKPPGISLEEILRIKEAFIGNSKLRFGFNHRYYSHIQKAKEIIDSGELGKILWMRGVYGKSRLENWRQIKELGGRGILLSQGIHMIDLFQYLSGEEIEEVKSFVSSFHKDWDKIIEDNVFAIMKTKSGIVTSLHSSAVLYKNTFQLHIGLEKGYIHIDNVITSTRSFGFPEIVSIAKASDTFFYGNPKEEVYRFGEDVSWKKEIERFGEIIMNDEKEYECSIRDAINVMKVIEMIYDIHR
jgi:predicted dehydrogenase